MMLKAVLIALTVGLSVFNIVFALKAIWDVERDKAELRKLIFQLRSEIEEGDNGTEV